MMTIEEYRAAILQALLDTKNEDGTPAITPKEAQEAINGFTDDELQDGKQPHQTPPIYKP